MPLESFNFCFVRPVEREGEAKARVFVPRSGAASRQTRIDQPLKRKGEIRIPYTSWAKRNEIIAFHAAHYLTTNFNFADQDSGETFVAWISSGYKDSRSGFTIGEIVFTIEEV